MIINQELFDEIIAHALDILRLTASEKAKVFDELKTIEDKIVARLAKVDVKSLGKRDMAKLIKAASQIISEGYDNISGTIDLSAIGEATSKATRNAIVAVGYEGVSVAPAAYLKSLASDILILGAPTKDWWKAQAADTAMKFATQVRLGAANGETTQQIVQRIVGTKGQSGVMDIARVNATRLVHSSLQSVSADARRKTFEANDDIVKGIKQVSTLDSHTSLICIAYSGAEWNLKYEPINGNTLAYNGGVPRHWGCRSVEVPITKTFAEMGLDIPEPPGSTRASESGQIDVNTSFDDFLKRRGVAYQNEVLGVGRAELWRKGKITLKDLVASDGRPLTLEELLAKVEK